MAAAIDLCSDFDGHDLRHIARVVRTVIRSVGFWLWRQSMTAAPGTRLPALAVSVSRSCETKWCALASAAPMV